MSSEAVARTLDVPGTLRPDNVTGSSLLLRWNGLEPEHRPSSIAVQYRESGGANNEWQFPMNVSFEPDVTTELVPITNLLSATSYDYRFVATYTGTYTIDGKVLAFKEDYLQLPQQARTKAGVPTAPQFVEAKQDEEGWIVTWKEPMSDGGSPITSYAVETRINKTAEWEIAERGLDGWKTWWRPGKSDTTSSTSTSSTEVSEFRIRAANIEGFGAYAYTEDKKEEKEEEPSSVLPYLLLLSIIFLLAAMILVACFWLKSRRRQQQKKREAEDERNCIRLDVVANMNFSSSHQSLPPEYESEMRNLPVVNYSTVTFNDYIDTCAYGIVHSGTAEEVPMSWEKDVRVAIKKLKPNHSFQEKMMFMKEAILLNNLDHPNIVKELGVCITPGQELILLEYMEGGNLLKFLQKSTPNEYQSSELSPRDLLSISVDIARGMNYLERLPHVHKNLSARKCLLAGRPGVTKLEMGMSKELSNGQVNRSDLENMEIVRWMAPEVLKDFQFSSKSDVWAYGVLLYEVFSFGEVPYGDKDNRRIMTDVRNGSVLPIPSYCPSKRIYKVIKQCLTSDSTKRANFATILKIFETFRDDQKCQDDKPIQFNDGTDNTNFSASQDSTSSREPPSPSHRMRDFIDTRDLEPPSPSHLNQSFGGFEHPYEGERPATMWNGSGARNSAKNSIGRSMKKEKLRNPIHSMDDLVARNQRPLSIHSEDTESTDYGASSSMYSPGSSNRISSQVDPPIGRLSSAPGIGIVNDAFESSNPSLNLSRSWAGLSREVNQNPAGAGSSGTLPQHTNSAGHLRLPGVQVGAGGGRVYRNASGGGGPSNRGRISQV